MMPLDEMRQAADGQRALCMADGIHPTQAEYPEWWTPYMEEFLIGAVQ